MELIEEILDPALDFLGLTTFAYLRDREARWAFRAFLFNSLVNS